MSVDDGLKHIDKLLKPCKAKDIGTSWIRSVGREKCSVVEPCVYSWTDQIGQYLDIELDLRHAPLIINESGCNVNTKTLSTARKLQDDLVLDSRKSPILKREDSTRYRSACVRLSCLAQDRLDLAKIVKHLAQRMNEPREFDSIPRKRAARYLVGMPRAALRFQRQEHEDKISLHRQCFRWRSCHEKKHDGREKSSVVQQQFLQPVISTFNP